MKGDLLNMYVPFFIICVQTLFYNFLALSLKDLKEKTEKSGNAMRLCCYVFTSAVADITVLSGVISLLFLFSIWLDLRSVSLTINTYIQLVRHLLLFLFTGVGFFLKVTTHINCIVVRCLINFIYHTACAFIRS